MQTIDMTRMEEIKNMSNLMFLFSVMTQPTTQRDTMIYHSISRIS